MVGRDSPIHGRALMGAMIEAGIINDWAQRVVIDVSLTDVPRIYVEQIGSKTLVDVLPKVVDLLASPLTVVKDEEEKSNED